MSAHDVSRHLFNPGNHYSGLRMQQGRVVLDSDINETRMIDDEEQRLLVLDVVGPHGSPDSGFTIANVHTTAPYDFEIRAGTYYLGGYRHEIAGAGPLDPQTFRGQTNWLQSSRSDEDPALPTIPTAPRHDFVYLVGWEQGVTTVEDSELREQAIAGHDTGYRIRRMQRVYVRKDSSATCRGAFAALVTDLLLGGHSFDLANYELKSGARMTVHADPIATADDLCTPPVLQGFAGAENQAIRVQLVKPDRLLWSLDNASPLHRITVTVAADIATLTLLTKPRDHAHIPVVGQIIELLPWGAALPNGEYVADHEISAQLGGGVLARVLTPYNPTTGTLTVSPESNTALGQLLAWFVTKGIPVGDRYLFARLWNPGDDAAAAQFGLTFVPGQDISLKGTGLKVKFNGVGIVGDYWIIGARPSTPKPVVPWDLELDPGAAPHGPRRFYSPLALLDWTVDGEGPHVAVHSCRRTFRPLTRLRGCCTVTVGDDVTSFGDFSSINEALRALPLLEPGKICILPGEYRERVVIDGRSDLVIEGCGARTVLRTPTPNITAEGLITINCSTNITVRAMSIDAVGQFGVMVLGESIGSYTYCKDILLERLDITTRRDPSLPEPSFADLRTPAGSSAFPLSTIAVYLTLGVKVLDCNLTMHGELSAAPNVRFSRVWDGFIRDCRVRTLTNSRGVSHAWGGIQLSDGLRVTVERNEIVGGVGHGITLGSLYYDAAVVEDFTGYFDNSARFVLADDVDCPNVAGDFPLLGPHPGGDDDVAISFRSAPLGLNILHNRIHSMGGSGIAVIGFGPDVGEAPDEYAWMVSADNLVVADNVIEDNYRRPAHEPPPPGMIPMLAFGGIVLGIADGLRIHDNRIRHNGRDHRYPVCGIFVYHGEDIAVENNLIDANGPRVDGTGLSGNRAGIALQFVGRRVSAVAAGYSVDSDNLMPAARVRGNVVHQPAGRALQIYGLGAIFVEGNSFVSEGLADIESSLLAHCIEIQNVGQSPELGLEGAIPANLAYLPSPPLPQVPLPVVDDLLDGRILFTDNQVHFKPVASAAVDISWSVRLQSYGDVAVLDNQFLVTFPIEGGSMDTDTSIVAWSTRTNNNRWEDPIVEFPDGVYQTAASASTLARMNFTALNQASRCIHVAISPNTPVIGNNPVDDNQTYTSCPVPGFAALLEPAP